MAVFKIIARVTFFCFIMSLCCVKADESSSNQVQFHQMTLPKSIYRIDSLMSLFKSEIENNLAKLTFFFPYRKIVNKLDFSSLNTQAYFYPTYYQFAISSECGTYYSHAVVPVILVNPKNHSKIKNNEYSVNLRIFFYKCGQIVDELSLSQDLFSDKLKSESDAKAAINLYLEKIVKKIENLELPEPEVIGVYFLKSSWNQLKIKADFGESTRVLTIQSGHSPKNQSENRMMIFSETVSSLGINEKILKIKYETKKFQDDHLISDFVLNSDFKHKDEVLISANYYNFEYKNISGKDYAKYFQSIFFAVIQNNFVATFSKLPSAFAYENDDFN